MAVATSAMLRTAGQVAGHVKVHVVGSGSSTCRQRRVLRWHAQFTCAYQPSRATARDLAAKAFKTGHLVFVNGVLQFEDLALTFPTALILRDKSPRETAVGHVGMFRTWTSGCGHEVDVVGGDPSISQPTPVRSWTRTKALGAHCAGHGA